MRSRPINRLSLLVPRETKKMRGRACATCRLQPATIGDLCEPCEDAIGEHELRDEAPKPRKVERPAIEVWHGRQTIREVLSRVDGRVTYRTGKRQTLRTQEEILFDLWCREATRS